MKRLFILVALSLLVMSCGNDSKSKLTSTAWSVTQMGFKPDPSNETDKPWIINGLIEKSYVEFRNDTCYGTFAKVNYPYTIKGDTIYAAINGEEKIRVIRELTSDKLVIDEIAESIGVHTYVYKAIPFERYTFNPVISALSRKYLIQDVVIDEPPLYVFAVRVAASPEQIMAEGSVIAEDVKNIIGRTIEAEPIVEKNCPTKINIVTYDSYSWDTDDFLLVLRNYFEKNPEVGAPNYFNSEIEINVK